jgi:hypothetical protein
MTNEKKQALKDSFKKVGKAIWSAFPWICWGIALTCWLMLPILHASEEAELEKQIAALEAENAMYESQNARLDEEIDWLRSLIEQEDGDGQIQP